MASSDQLRRMGIGWLFDAIRDVVIVAGAEDGRIVLWNPAAALFGYAEAEALGLTVDALVPDRFKALHLAGRRRYAAGGQGAVIAARHPIEIAALRREGTELAVELTLNPMADLPGEQRFVLALIRDLTERRRPEAERAAAQREGAVRVAGSVMHNLAGPLGAILGIAELRLDDAQVPAELRDDLRFVVGQVQRASQLLQQFGRISRYEETTSPVGPLLDLERAGRPEGEAPG